MGVLRIPAVGDLGSLTCFRCLFSKGVQVGVAGKLSEAPMTTVWESRNPAKHQSALQSKEKDSKRQLKPLLQQPRHFSTSERRSGHKFVSPACPPSSHSVQPHILPPAQSILSLLLNSLAQAQARLDRPEYSNLPPSSTSPSATTLIGPNGCHSLRLLFFHALLKTRHPLLYPSASLSSCNWLESNFNSSTCFVIGLECCQSIGRRNPPAQPYWLV